MRSILLLGRQGAGKGAIGGALADELDGVHLSAGSLLRAGVRHGDLAADEIGGRIDQGHGVREDISYGLLEAALSALDSDSLAILDGYPREVAQVSRLAYLLGGEPGLVVHLEVPLPIAVSRLRSRQVCEECDAAYGPGIPASSLGRCGRCGGALGVRADDTPDALARRLAGWRNRSPEILAHYEALGILVEVDATPPFAQVRAEVLSVAADLANSGPGPRGDPR